MKSEQHDTHGKPQRYAQKRRRVSPPRSQAVHEKRGRAPHLVMTATNPSRAPLRICRIGRGDDVSGNRCKATKGDMTMIRNIALAAALVFGTATVALSQEADPNLFNRYPAYNMTKGVGAWQSRSVALTGHVG